MRKKMKFEILISEYFNNFPKLLFTNLIFLLPLAVSFFLCYLLNVLLKTSIVFFLMILLCLPFYSGVVLVTRNIARGDKDIRVFNDFLKAFKNNFLQFLLHGFIGTIIALLGYFAFNFYSQHLDIWFFYVILFLCIIIAIICMFAYFYIPLMTVTFDIKMKYIYKNSFLMALGEIKNNFFATLCIVIVAAILLTLFMFTYNIRVLFYILVVVIFGLILPSTISFIINFFIYDGMYDMIANNEEKVEQIIGNNGNESNTKKPSQNIITDNDEDFDISKLKDTDDYIYYKGKMIKQSTLLKELKNKENDK